MIEIAGFICEILVYDYDLVQSIVFVNQCICAGDKEALIECKIGANMINEYVDGEDTLLMKAVMECAPDMVRILMEKGADPNCSSRNGKTPLMTAVELVRIIHTVTIISRSIPL